MQKVQELKDELGGKPISDQRTALSDIHTKSEHTVIAYLHSLLNPDNESPVNPVELGFENTGYSTSVTYLLANGSKHMFMGYDDGRFDHIGLIEK